MRVMLELENTDWIDELVLEKLCDDLMFVMEDTYGETRVETIKSFLQVIKWYCDPDNYTELAGAFSEECLKALPDNDPLFKFLYSECWK